MKNRSKLLIVVVAVTTGSAIICCGGTVSAVWWYFFSGESNQEIINRYSPKFAEKREQLKRIAGKLPPIGAVNKPVGAKDLSPAPVFDVETKEMNCSILMYDHLLDPDKDVSRTGDIELIIPESQLRYGLLWTGPRNPMANTRERRTKLDVSLDKMLEQPYVVIVRKAAYMPPKRIVGGEIHAFAAFEVFLVRYDHEEVVASMRIETDSKPFQGRLKEGADAERHIYSDIVTASIGSIERSLNEHTNGRFKLRR